MWDRWTTFLYLCCACVCACVKKKYSCLCVCAVTVHLVYHLFMAAISLSPCPPELLTSSSVHSLPPSALSQGAETFLPSALHVSGGPQPLLLCLPLSFLFLSFIPQWPLCPVLLKRAFPSIHSSLHLPEESQFLLLLLSSSPCRLPFPLTQPWACCGGCARSTR